MTLNWAWILNRGGFCLETLGTYESVTLKSPAKQGKIGETDESI